MYYNLLFMHNHFLVSDGEIIPSEFGFPCHSLAQENYTCSGCIQLHDSCAWCLDFVSFLK